MPNKFRHTLFNSIIGILSGLVLYDELINFLIFTVLCIATAMLPDIIEKPVNKYHRKFFHSYMAFFGALIIFAAISFNPLSGLLYGYSCHILLDKARTKSFADFKFERGSEKEVEPREQNNAS